jgi:2-dehydro-3-deoxyphosphogluconate aldolase/(4S)-4-hydroxy-2-oxoglutarate aldolase
MTRAEVCAEIKHAGIIPAIRVATADEALFAARAVFNGGILIAEMTMTIPNATDVMRELMKHHPNAAIGAGTVLDVETAQRCLDAGASFLTSTGLDDMVALAEERKVVVIPGALTPTEVMSAKRAGVDFVKIFPCANVGGPAYITALHRPFPDVPMIASGGVTQQNAGDFIRAGAVALGIGEHLIPREAVEARDLEWIRELSKRFLHIVMRARAPKIALDS